MSTVFLPLHSLIVVKLPTISSVLFILTVKRHKCRAPLAGFAAGETNSFKAAICDLKDNHFPR
jgi:hypothetical protein